MNFVDFWVENFKLKYTPLFLSVTRIDAFCNANNRWIVLVILCVRRPSLFLISFFFDRAIINDYKPSSSFSVLQTQISISEPCESVTNWIVSYGIISLNINYLLFFLFFFFAFCTDFWISGNNKIKLGICILFSSIFTFNIRTFNTRNIHTNHVKIVLKCHLSEYLRISFRQVRKGITCSNATNRIQYIQLFWLC